MVWVSPPPAGAVEGSRERGAARGDRTPVDRFAGGRVAVLSPDRPIRMPPERLERPPTPYESAGLPGYPRAAPSTVPLVSTGPSPGHQSNQPHRSFRSSPSDSTWSGCGAFDTVRAPLRLTSSRKPTRPRTPMERLGSDGPLAHYTLVSDTDPFPAAVAADFPIEPGSSRPEVPPSLD